MDNNENNTQEFTPQDGGYTQAPSSQGAAPEGQDSGQQNAPYQPTGQNNGQQNAPFQASSQNNGQQNAPYQASGQNNGQQNAPFQASGQYNGQQNAPFQASGQYNGQQNAPFQASGQYNGQQMNGQPYAGQGYVPQQNEPKGFAIAGMVLGIVSIVCCCSPIIGGITGLLGLIFSIIVLVQKRPGKGMAIAGIICAVIGLLLSISMYFANNSMMEYINSQGGMENILRDIENSSNGYY